MSIFSWNLRGFNAPRKHAVFKSWVQTEKPMLGGLLETCVQEQNFSTIFSSTLPGWNSINNYNFHRLSRIWVIWNGAVDVLTVASSAQHITCQVRIRQSGIIFLCSFVYASNFVEERRGLWTDLCRINDFIPPDTPWVVLGDFNVTISSSEHSNQEGTSSHSVGMQDFQNLIAECSFSDMAFSGPTFIWCNNRAADPIAKKLDRVLINNEWLSPFPYSAAIFESGGISDHVRCIIRFSNPTTGTKRPFKFFNFFASHPQFQDTVLKIWNESPALYHSRSALQKFHKKLKSLKYYLKALNKETYGGIREHTKVAFENLCSQQEAMLHSAIPQQQSLLMEATKRWNHLRSIEEQFHRQKSRIQWLKEGDQNTSYFHKIAQGRAARNAIHQICTQDGTTIHDPQGIKKEAGDYFKDFLQDLPGNFRLPDDDFLAKLIDYRCPTHLRQRMVQDITGQEIKDALFSMSGNKSPGPDGYPMEFFRAAWGIIGCDFITAVQSFFWYSFMPRGVNATVLALIPKVSEACTMKDYRPIACCNIVYKVIAKILSNRLKLMLPNMIELNQSAFIEGRLLLENVLLATELVKDYHKNSGSSRCALKIDIAKAFDTIRWPFIIVVLRAMHLPALSIRWIEVCITTASFSVSVNGELEVFFHSNRGLRQGCALSPYLFVIINNVLSRLLNTATEKGVFGYHPKCKLEGITHLSFADDILIFSDGKISSIKGILKVLDDFSLMSGLQVNTGKSEIFLAGKFSSTVDQENVEGIPLRSLPICYLGLPLTTRSMKASDYAPLLDRIRTRLLGWSSKHLSYAGRLQLLTSIISSIVNFWLSVFCLPKKFLKAIESICNAFLWSGSPNSTRKSKVSWEDVCVPKKEGGLGIRRLVDSSRVFAYSLIWRLISSSGSLWTRWVRRNLIRNHTFWDTPVTTLGSWAWKKLLRYRRDVKDFLHAEIGKGDMVSFWFDNWTPHGPLIVIFGENGPRFLGIAASATVKEATRENAWRFSQRARNQYEVIKWIQNTAVPNNNNGNDIFLWRHATGQFKTSFSASKTWEQIRVRRNVQDWSALVWFSQGIPRCSFMVSL